MSELTLHLAGHDIYMVQDGFGTWLVDGQTPYTEWIEKYAPQEVIDEAARKGMEMAIADPEATEDAIQSLEMPDDMANMIRAFYPTR
jgi:hypothetical protein